MAKRCPVCGAEFPGYANVCDQDGAALVVRRHRSLWPLVVAAVVVGTFGVLAAWFWVSKQMSAEIIAVRVIRPAGAESDASSLGRWLAGKQLVVEAYVHNGSWFPVLVDARECSLTVGAIRGSGAKWSAFMGIPVGATQSVEWVFPLTDEPLRGAVTRPPNEGIPVEIRASMRVLVGGIEWPVPFERRFVVKLSL